MKNILLMLFTTIGIFMSSCEKPVEGLNDNPNEFTDAPISLLLNHTLLNVASIAEAEPARISAIFTDQFTGVDRQYGTLNGYSTLATTYEEMWEDLYQRGISQAQITKQKAQDGNNILIEGQALILEAYYFAEAALVFGDIPFSEVNNPEMPDPKYEAQESVLRATIEMIKEGISKSGSISASNNIFKTSSTWSQIGNALLARYYLALGDMVNANSAANAANFTSSDNDWSIKHSSANYGENLFWQFEVEQRQDYLKVENSYMSNLLNSKTDVYRGNSKTDETARFNYYVAPNGLSLNTTTGFASQTRSFPVISFEEIQLIIAESSTTETEAIKALNKVRNHNAIKYNSKYDDYLLSDFQPNGILNKGLSMKDAIKMEILLEKYCSVIGLPTFQDVLRTKNFIGVPIKSSETNVIPQRFIYPSTEESSNSNFPGYTDQFVPTPIYR